MRSGKIFFIILCITAVYITYHQHAFFIRKKAAFVSLEKEIRKTADGFSGTPGIFVKDLKMHWEIVINGDALFPSASLVKIPIMAACFYAEKEGSLKLDELITLRNEHKVSGSGSLKHLPAGTEFTVESLIELMITESDNTASNMIIDRLGFDYLNGIFKRLQLEQTNIDRKMMDFKKRKEGIENYTSVSDMALLLDRMYKGILIDRKVSRKCIDYLKRQKSRDRIPARLPKKTVVAHKTGLERGVCHDVGIIFTPEEDVLVSVLTKHRDPNSRKAKQFIAHIALSAYEYARETVR